MSWYHDFSLQNLLVLRYMQQRNPRAISHISRLLNTTYIRIILLLSLTNFIGVYYTWNFFCVELYIILIKVFVMYVVQLRLFLLIA